MSANRRLSDQPAPGHPVLSGAPMGLGVLIGAATGLLLLSDPLFGGDLALGVAAGAGLGLLIGAGVELLRGKE